MYGDEVDRGFGTPDGDESRSASIEHSECGSSGHVADRQVPEATAKRGTTCHRLPSHRMPRLASLVMGRTAIRRHLKHPTRARG
jgi:hypothetical protein